MRRIITAGLASLLAGVALSGCIFGDCENIVLDTLASPDGAHEVRVWRRNCGATTAYSFHFELVEADAPQRDIAREGQVFLIGQGGRDDYTLSWRAPGALSVDLGVGEDFIFKAEPDLEVGERTVVISYTGRGAP
ncbi:MAG: hypothetical protein ACFE0P_09600 [Oceanicaulis sp.]